ncbi:MAG: DUF3047 domain-containing protein [Alphaproteobacteria bacterium]|nr:DUF3047 domain-containing protein [Alphaproteobacteria bacterium]
MPNRIRRALAVLLLAPLLGAPAERLPTPDPLRDAGWTKGGWSGIEPATFEALPEGGLRLTAQAQGSFVWRPVDKGGECLSWRWRVDAGPPPTPLDRRGGDDRAIAVTVGFDGWPAETSFIQRTKHALAQALAGDHRLPRSMLVYAWGGTGREPRPFTNPYMHGLGEVFVLRAADAGDGRWFEEKVELARDWKLAFRGATAPPAMEITVATDVDDTRSRLDARIERIRLGPC